MPRCIKCNYELVLLSNRPKYKCALCSRLFPQKQVVAISFRTWNQKQRELDRHNLSLERKRRLKLTEEEKRQRIREYYLKNRDRLLKAGLEYRQKNRARLIEKDSIWRENNRERYNERKGAYQKRAEYANGRNISEGRKI